MKQRALLLAILLLVFIVIGVIPFASNLGNIKHITQKSNASLIVEEYRIISQDFDTPDHLEFCDKIDSKILEKRKKWREAGIHKDKMSCINEELGVFKYKLVRNEKPSRFQPSYNIYYDQDLILPAISGIRCFRINKKRDKFLFVASQPLENGPPYGRDLLFLNGEIQEWNNWEHDYTCPIFVDDTLMTVDRLTKERKKMPPHGIYQFAVRKGSQTVYSFSAKEITDNAVKSFFAWDDDWILEYQDIVIISRVNIGEKNNYSKVFYYRKLKGKPFYFFEQNKKIHISYDDEVLPYKYDEVIHNRCCGPAAFNIRGNENMIWFYASEDGFWYYVEAGIYKE